MTDLRDYYARRAPEYEALYHRPGHQHDLARMEESLLSIARGRDVLELACGTGWWTARMATAARAILAIDPVNEVLELARAKEYPPGRVRLRQGDAWRLEEIDGHFSLVVLAFFWSHIPRREISLFLEGIIRRFPDGVTLWLADNRYVEGTSTPVHHVDAHGNSWQKRRLADGSEHDVMKNFHTPDQLVAAFRPYVRDMEVRLLDYFWIVEAELQPREREEPEGEKK